MKLNKNTQNISHESKYHITIMIESNLLPSSMISIGVNKLRQKSINHLLEETDLENEYEE